MELFTINRYDDKFSQVSALDEEQEDTNLQKLLQKAEKRKRKLKEVQIHKELSNNDHENIEENVIKDLEEDFQTEAVELKKSNVFDEKKDDIDNSQDFKVLGTNVFQKKLKVNVVLPPWLAHPTIITTQINKSEVESKDLVANLSYLSSEIKDGLRSMNINELFPVQKELIPWLLKVHSKPSPFRPRDVCVSAPTGSGKTLAFATPIVQLLSNRVEKKVRALIVLPVNELALQVFKVFKKLCDKTDLTVCLLSKSFQFIAEQSKIVGEFKGKYYSKADIIVTTPGRLVEHIHSTKGLSLKSLKFLVIDEADRIMDQVHQNWLYHLDNHVKNTSDMLLSGHVAPLTINELTQSAKNQPNKLLFSATLSQDPEKLQSLRLFQPKLFTSVIANLEEIAAKLTSNQHESNVENSKIRGDFIGKYTTPIELSEKYCLTESQLKPLTLFSLIKSNSWNKFLCFTNSAESANRLAFVLQYLFDKKDYVSELSATLKPKERMNVMSSFVRGKINGLVCSDALARGIDLPDVDIVISYDAPRHVKTYIHRIGRTARAGRAGTAITLLTEKELISFNALLAEVDKNLCDEVKGDPMQEESYAHKYTLALKDLRKHLENKERMRKISKQLAKERLNPFKPEKLSVMAKLQEQAKDELFENLVEYEDDYEAIDKEKPKKKRMKSGI